MPLMAISFLASCNKTKQYTVTFDSNGGSEVPSQKIDENKCATEPKSPTRNEDDIGTYSFHEWQLEGVAFDFNTPITKDITLKADWNITHKYSVAVGTHSHLLFTTTDGKDLSSIKAIEGQDFTFKMNLVEESNATIYKLPTQLSIFIGDSKYPLAKGVTITETVPNQEANVTIAANQITNNIKINGSATPINYYEIKIHNYNVKIDSSDYDPQNPYAEPNQDKVITFIQDEKYALPTSENIALQIDGKDWINPKDSGDCSYDENTHKLTINANKVNSNVTIVVGSPDYSLLENFSWDEINDCSVSGYAPALFKVGEEKTIEVNDIDQKVRIIDFNHDDLMEKEGKAGITFEFVNLLSDSDGYSLATLWDTRQGESTINYDYLKSDLRYALDGKGERNLVRWYKKGSTASSVSNEKVFDMLPYDLQDYIKPVKKLVGISKPWWRTYDTKDYEAKIFVLTRSEMTTSIAQHTIKEGTTYQYYIDHDNDSSRIKYQIKGIEGATSEPEMIYDLGYYAESYAGYNNPTNDNGGFYWLTSPCTHRAHIACRVNDCGGIDNELENNITIYRTALPIAPAFCI